LAKKGKVTSTFYTAISETVSKYIDPTGDETRCAT